MNNIVKGSADWHPQTRVIRDRIPPTREHEHSSPLFLTSSFCFDSLEQGRALFADEINGNVYSRYTNPNLDEFTARMTALEHAERGVATASGMAALFAAVMTLGAQGKHLIASRGLFGSTLKMITQWLPQWGITHTLVDNAAPLECWARAIQKHTYLCLIETPSNPHLEIIDIAAMAYLCRERDIVLLVDNACATPILQTPLTHGAHLVMHTTTKYLDGQGRLLGGVVLGESALIERIDRFVRYTGAAMSAFNAWLFSKSLETLLIRMETHCRQAQRVAELLSTHSAVAWVRYPGLSNHPQYALAQRQMRMNGGLVTLGLKHAAAATRCCDALQLCSRSANFGDTRTIVTHPATTTHSGLSESERQAVGIGTEMLRISVGLEYIDDILADLTQALEGC